MRMTFGRLVMFLCLLCLGIVPGMLYLGYLGITDRQERNSADPVIRAATRHKDRRARMSLLDHLMENKMWSSTPRLAIFAFGVSLAFFALVFHH